MDLTSRLLCLVCIEKKLASPQLLKMASTPWSRLRDLRAFRVLHLQRVNHDGHITCSLAVGSIDHAPDYTAISYHWGEVNLTHKLVCDGKELPITGRVHAMFTQVSSSRTSKFDGQVFCGMTDVYLDLGSVHLRSRHGSSRIQVELLRVDCTPLPPSFLHPCIAHKIPLMLHPETAKARFHADWSRFADLR